MAFKSTIPELLIGTTIQARPDPDTVPYLQLSSTNNASTAPSLAVFVKDITDNTTIYASLLIGTLS